MAGCGFLIFSAPVLAGSCRPGGPPHYSVENDRVIYDFYGATSFVVGADAATFKAMPQPPHALGPCAHAEDGYYGSDQSRVFYEGKPIAGAHPASFHPLAEHEYGVDDKSVFYQGKKLAGADPASFHILIWPEGAGLRRSPGEKFSIYAADAHHVWEQDRPMPQFDAATFTLLPLNYVKDKNAVYRNDRPVPGLDPRTFDGTQQH